MKINQTKLLFLIASIYDCVAGAVFALLYKPIYEFFKVDLPNHAGYVQLAGLYVAIFGVGFYLVYRDPIRNLSLVLLGILMKLAFVMVVLGNALFGSSPLLFVPFAAVDLLFMLLFIAAYTSLRKLSDEEALEGV